MIKGLRIIATYACSNKCSFCYQSTKDSVYLTPENLERALVELKEVPEYVTLMGGEVSEYPEETDKLLSILSKRFDKISITTNGNGDVEWYKSLFNKGVTNISFSLYSIHLTKIIDKMKAIKPYGSVRANCFFNRESDMPSKVLQLCRKNGFNLTLCEDIYKNEYHKDDIVKGLNIDDEIANIEDNEQSVIVKLFDDYQFWIFRHIENYNNDNFIVLPNGTITFDFNDVTKGVGHA